MTNKTYNTTLRSGYFIIKSTFLRVDYFNNFSVSLTNRHDFHEPRVNILPMRVSLWTYKSHFCLVTFFVNALLYSEDFVAVLQVI